MKHFTRETEIEALMAIGKKEREDAKTVQSHFDDVYKELSLTVSEWERGVLENQAYRDTVNKLNPHDRDTVLEIQKELTQNRKMRNFGETSALELTAKLGIFFRANHFGE